METPPTQSQLLTADGKLTGLWAAWFNNLWIYAAPMSGTTAQRPVNKLYIGKMYFDTTLGKPIWLKAYDSATGASTWVLATGASV